MLLDQERKDKERLKKEKERLEQERRDKERLEKERLEKENQPFWVKWKNMSLSQIVWNVIKLMFGAASLTLIVNSALGWFSIKANEKIAEIQRQQYLAQK